MSLKHSYRAKFGVFGVALLLFSASLARPVELASANTQSRAGSTLPRYNFPPASRGDRFARKGLDMRTGISGWKRYRDLIKKVCATHAVDPFVVGAYIWVESNFDPNQDYANDEHHAVGLGSVQPADYRYRYSTSQLKEPLLNVTLTAREFKDKWREHDIYGTVLDVWYPAWRRRVARGERIPVVHYPDVYIQAIANRYYALHEIDRHLISQARPS